MKSRLHPLALLTPILACAAPQTIIDDTFDDGDPTGHATAPGLWRLQTITGDNGVFENSGNLTLFATTKSYTFAGLNTALDERLNFFVRPLTITVEDLVLESKGIPNNEAVFRLSLNSTELRQNMSPQSLSIRFSPGSALMGYKTGPVEKLAAEDVSGTTRGSVFHETFDGNVTWFRIQLDPQARPGFITYTVTLRTNGSRGTITRSGEMDLRSVDWNADGRSAIVMEARRNTATVAADTYMSASIGRLTVTTP